MLLVIISERSSYKSFFRFYGEIKMKNQAEEIRAFILEKIPEHPKDIVAVTASQFSVSRTTVHRHLNKLAKDNKIIKTGTTNKATYFLFSSRDKTIETKITPKVDEHEIWKNNFERDFASLRENVYGICDYGFTEILNNAIVHSEGTSIYVKTEWSEGAVDIFVADNGIGIFQKIKTALNLKDIRESILELSKGKVTTDPERHTGEGIFFTSRAFDEFAINANGLTYIKLNIEDDWFVETQKGRQKEGTFISMKIRFNSGRTLQQVFGSYSNSETYRFDKTHILVKLSKFEEDKYISRSQAKRLLTGLEKFRDIIFDFKGITTVGQGFVDEIFRVFKNKHPEIKIRFCNENNDVKFMIKRGLPTLEDE